MFNKLPDKTVAGSPRFAPQPPGTPATRICLYLDRSRVFQWHHWLATRLAAAPGHQVFLAFSPDRHPLPRACALVFAVERLVYRVTGQIATDPADGPMDAVAAASATQDAPFDVVINLAGCDDRFPDSTRVLTPCFNGVAGEIGVVAALIDERALLVEVADSARPAAPWSAAPASVDRDVFIKTLDNSLSCAVGLIVKAVAAPDMRGSVPARRDCPGRPPTAPAAGIAGALRAFAAVSRKMVRLLDLGLRGGRSWGVAWRFLPRAGLLSERSAPFHLMRDDGGRYYADPFPFYRNGRLYLFVEEFSYAAGRGCIAVAEIDGSGGAGAPRPIIEEPHHLSYPFVFEHDGDVWMIPESGEARGVYLYRAEQFPNKWKREACLIDNVEGYDATLLRRGARFWLFVCERVWHSSSWDTLSLFHSGSLTGPWRPHPNNPVLFDASLGRPAGAVFADRAQHIRPAQDCSLGYGGAISLCRIDALTEGEFAQTLIGRIHCGPYGCHTYNRGAGIEVIDVFGALRGVPEVTAVFEPVAPASRAPQPDTLGFAQAV